MSIKKMGPVKSVIVLTAICLIMAFALATINYITAPLISEAERKAENEALKVVLPAGEEFVELSEAENLPQEITKVYKDSAENGYVFRITVTGYSKGMVILCGVDAEGRVAGAVCLSSNETLGHEKTYGDRFKGVDSESIEGVDTISGATKTTSAYKSAISIALEAFEIISAEEGDAGQ